MSRREDDPLGKKCKARESCESGRKSLPGLPVVVRLDGRAFHTYCRGLEKPFDARLHACMAETTQDLVGNLHATLGYTQSDEITLAWTGAAVPFDGRFMKLATNAAGRASARFAQLAAQYLPARQRQQVPNFDGRAWQVASLEEALEEFQWREDDAVKNSVSAACHALYSAREMHGKSRAEQMDMLMAKGVNWNDLPAWQKRGTYYRRVSVERELSEAELSRIPETVRPPAGTKFIRSSVDAIVVPPLRRHSDPLSLLRPPAPT